MTKCTKCGTEVDDHRHKPVKYCQPCSHIAQRMVKARYNAKYYYLFRRNGERANNP
jgi:DNA-directed RNA polymerase subunit RPC12/RpoP